MAQYRSEDLRIRVIRAIEGGMSRNAAARHFDVSIASAVRWMAAYLRTGRTAPNPRGGDRRSGRIEAQADFLMAAIADAPDVTLAELRDRLIEERGETFAISTIHDFFRRHGVSYKKSPRMPASKSAKMSRPDGKPGSPCNLISIQRGSSFSTKPAQRPRWPACAGALPAASAAEPACRTGIGRPRR